MDWIIGPLIGLAVVLVPLSYYWYVNSKKRNDLKSQLQKKFPHAKIYVSHFDFSFIVFDQASKTISLNSGCKKFEIGRSVDLFTSVYSFNDITEVSIETDQAVIATTNRGSQVAGVAVGALALGGVGALIGGLSASSIQNSRVRKLLLVLKVNDIEHPIHKVTFLDCVDKSGVDKDNAILIGAQKQIEEFATRIFNIVNDRGLQNNFERGGIADQIRELWNLKEMGAITKEEYDTEKSRLTQR